MVDLSEYQRVFYNIINICERYSYLFENRDRSLEIFSFFTAPDESEYLFIKLTDKGFDYLIRGGDPEHHYSREEIAKRYRRYNIPPDDIFNGFKRRISKPLGEYLAKRELEYLEYLLI